MYNSLVDTRIYMVYIYIYEELRKKHEDMSRVQFMFFFQAHIDLMEP